MTQVTKNIEVQTMIVGFTPSTSCHECKLSPNDIVFVSISPQKRKTYQKESLINEDNRLRLIVCDSFTVFDNTRTDKQNTKQSQVRKLTEKSS